MQHGLYSLKNFDSFIHDNDLALTVITNCLEQFKPVTPTEHALVHQLIHQQLRFLQMEYLFNQVMSFRLEQILKTPVPFLTQITRELDRLPARIQRTINRSMPNKNVASIRIGKSKPSPTSPLSHIAAKTKFTPLSSPKKA